MQHLRNFRISKSIIIFSKSAQSCVLVSETVRESGVLELLYVCFRRFQPTPQLSQENASPCAKKCLKVPSIITISNILIFAHQQNSRTLSGESLVSLTTFLFSVSFHSETLETRVSYFTTKQNCVLFPGNASRVCQTT